MNKALYLLSDSLNYFDTNIELSGESILDMDFSKVPDSLANSFTFLRETLSFSITDFLDDSLHTGLPRRIKDLSYVVKAYDYSDYEIKFSDIKDRVTTVPPGYETRMDLKATLLTDEMKSLIKNTKGLLDRYHGDLSLFITNEDKRSAKYFNRKLYDNIEKKQVSVNDKILKLAPNDGNGQTTIGKLIGSVAGYKYTVNSLVDLFDSKIDEKDLKKALKDIQGIRAKVEAVIEIVETEKVSEQAIDVIIALNTVVANQYTLLSKFYHMVFELSQISLNNWQYINKGSKK